MPFTVAVNQFEGQQNLSLDEVRLAANVNADVPVVEVDARVRESVKSTLLTTLHLVLMRAKARGAARR